MKRNFVIIFVLCVSSRCSTVENGNIDLTELKNNNLEYGIGGVPHRELKTIGIHITKPYVAREFVLSNNKDTLNYLLFKFKNDTSVDWSINLIFEDKFGTDYKDVIYYRDSISLWRKTKKKYLYKLWKSSIDSVYTSESLEFPS